MNLLNAENPIAELKRMDKIQLELAAMDIRKELIADISKTGGHLASNLGVVELTMAIHKVFDSPTDKIIFDVGHQAYIHKMLTGRNDRMNTLRKLDGLSGFPKRSESEHDMYDSGHSGTSISAAFGYAKARDMKHEDYNVIAVIGDGALTGGVAWEALNSVGASQTPLIVILNDNNMSISNNIGGVHQHLESLRTNKGYLNLKQSIKDSMGGPSSKAYNMLREAKDSIKYAITMPGVIFEELGFKYYGPIDGHNFTQLIDNLELAKNLRRPVLLHVVTEKGLGFGPAEANPVKYHGVGPFDPETADAVINRDEESYSEIFGRELCNLAKDDDRICAITAAMSEATGLTEMRFKFPWRVFDAGIAEQHAVSFAAGLALNGMKPVVAIYSTFLQRAYDQMLMEVCMQNLPVVFVVDRSGVVGPDGETHQGVFDITYLSSMPNMTVLSPKDGKELKEMLRYALSLNSPAAIRYPRGKAPDLSQFGPAEFTPSPEFLVNGIDVCMLTDGNMAASAIGAADLLAQNYGISAAVCNLRVLKPLPVDMLKVLMNRYNRLVVIEDGMETLGLGTHIKAIAKDMGYRNRILSIAWPEKFIEAGSIAELRARYGMNAFSIARRTEEFFSEEKT